MKKKTTLSEEDQALFRQLMAGTRKIKQDTIVHRPQRKKISEVPVKRLIQEQADASHYFSDEFQPLLNTEGPVKYVRPDVSHFEAKKLRRGDYSPELFLDLHGLTQLQAKQELGALIAACRREHVFCACVMHGHGKHIGFAPIFPDTCYHLTHYWPAAVDIPVASDNPVHYADA
ncbi:endonuclease SmrB, partial [Escherichia coli]|uniref:endonuclease SmrB n=1 Tax=Escherichia coli TaxID=562 RepID=UPI002023B9BC